MKAKEITIVENKKGRRAVKHNLKPRNPMGTAPQTGAGSHRDKKKEQKQGYEKHKGQGVAEGRGNIEALRTELMGEYLNIYYNALDGWDMTDHIINLQDVYGRVKRSRDPVLQQTYNLLMDHAEESIDVQASAALKAIRILGDEPNYTPPPRPPMSPEDSARADAFVNQFLAALVSNGIKTHPDWQKNNDKGVAEDTIIPFDQCPQCGGEIVHESIVNEKQDACYHKVRSRYKVWPSAYASGALVQCRKKGAKNWGNKSK